MALAQAWKKGQRDIVFLMAMEAKDIELRLESEGITVLHLNVEPGSIEDANRVSELAVKLKAAFVVLDGYSFGSKYQEIIKGAGLRLLFIDDYGHAGQYCADLVLNQNAYASDSYYKNRDPGTRLLLGSSYTLLRKEFWPWRDWRRDLPCKAQKIIVTMGGSDQDNVTLKVIEALKRLESVESIIVVGGGNRHCQELESASEGSESPMELLKNVADMPKLMAWADLALCSGGTTCWELAYMGLPSLTIVLSANQFRVAEFLDQAGISVNLGWHEELSTSAISSAVLRLLIDKETRDYMAIRGRRLVDGIGVKRVVEAMLMDMIELREVSKKDCHMLYEWANDPETRNASFSVEFIPLEEHVRWFEAKLRDDNCILLIAMDNEGTPLGYVRFDVTESTAIISVSIEKSFRGQDLGGPIIKKALDEVGRKKGHLVVNAFIKPHNLQSVKVFESAGFVCVGRTMVGRNEALHYIRTLNGL
ncbi:MAG: UDP-2,4-diacetamido-2,4,6-trideoxy-beta-L-altropyranose hydrolase [Methanotrichaceae archaeon]|nr:UDP-2,4-diacetamido-2,4,6-trideoxy-beta-L-altropyranose hydrolase [Methanotrichaceae archaeon]